MEIPSSRLDELCERIVDCPHSTPKWTASGVIVLRSENIKGGRLDLSRPSYTDEAHYADRTRRAVPTAGDLVITREAPMGEVCVIPPDIRCCLGQRMVLLRPDRAKVDPGYLLYALQSPLVQNEIRTSEGTGSTVSNLRIPLLESLPIPCAPLSDQRQIASILGALDEKIERNRRMTETLEAMVRALFKSWFVDFDPVHTMAQGIESGLPHSEASMLPSWLHGSELADIPTGWKVGRLDEVAGSPRRAASPQDLDPSTPYVGLEHMPRRSIALTEWATAEGLESGKIRFDRGEILFGKLRPYFHKVGMAPVDGVCSTDIVVVTPRKEGWSGFVLGHVSSDAFVAYADGRSTGTKMPRTSWHEMARYPIPLPPLALAEAFTSIIQPMTDRILSSTHESRTLAALRDTLLPKLISGDLRVPDAERIAVKAGT